MAHVMIVLKQKTELVIKSKQVNKNHFSSKQYTPNKHLQNTHSKTAHSTSNFKHESHLNSPKSKTKLVNIKHVNKNIKSKTFKLKLVNKNNYTTSPIHRTHSERISKQYTPKKHLKNTHSKTAHLNSNFKYTSHSNFNQSSNTCITHSNCDCKFKSQSLPNSPIQKSLTPSTHLVNNRIQHYSRSVHNSPIRKSLNLGSNSSVPNTPIFGKSHLSINNSESLYDIINRNKQIESNVNILDIVSASQLTPISINYGTPKSIKSVYDEVNYLDNPIDNDNNNNT